MVFPPGPKPTAEQFLALDTYYLSGDVAGCFAETLVRLLEARATSQWLSTGSVSRMFTIATGKTVTAQVIDDLEAMVDSDRALLSQLLLPLAVRSAAFRRDARVRFEAMARWIGRAFTRCSARPAVRRRVEQGQTWDGVARRR
ncbi:MAG: hypothetical protein HGA44_01695 [Cellulomonadaceae bacterium]|nr:hypothetical protein [Cellulomonadaceae bacterium]